MPKIESGIDLLRIRTIKEEIEQLKEKRLIAISESNTKEITKITKEITEKTTELEGL